VVINRVGGEGAGRDVGVQGLKRLAEGKGGGQVSGGPVGNNAEGRC